MPDDIENATRQYVPNDAESYDQWFARQVELGLAEADNPNTAWVTSDEVFRQINQRLNAMATNTGHRKAS
jgi:hypothetical protein